MVETMTEPQPVPEDFIYGLVLDAIENAESLGVTPNVTAGFVIDALRREGLLPHGIVYSRVETS
jgi:hypothetical protein